MDGVFSFLASRNGRITRIVVGAILVLIGLSVAFFGGSSFAGAVIAIIGVLPLVAGLTDICLFAPLVGKSYKGPELRAELGVEEAPAATEE